MSTRRVSYPRFSRNNLPARTVVLTDDDMMMLRYIRRYRFVRTTDLFALMQHRSSDRLSRRLTQLYRAGYLDRPASQIDAFRGRGSQPLVYGLDTLGVRAIAGTGEHQRTDSVRKRNQAFTRDNIDHTLATTAFMVSVDLTCREQDDLSFIPFEEWPRKHMERRDLRWPVELPWHGTCASVVVAPDAAFALRHASLGATKTSYVFVELDRGTMTIVPSDTVRRSPAFLYRSSILRKLLAYSISHRDGTHQRRFGIHAARNLFLTSSPARALEMQQAAETFLLPHLPVPNELFLFGVSGATDPLGTHYIDIMGQTASLLP